MISRLTSSILLALTVLLSVTDLIAQPAVSLESGWAKPPPDACLRAYWWWLNGNVTAKAITATLKK